MAESRQTPPNKTWYEKLWGGFLGIISGFAALVTTSATPATPPPRAPTPTPLLLPLLLTHLLVKEARMLIYHSLSKLLVSSHHP